MSREQVLTRLDIEGLRKVINERGVVGASAVYDILQHKYGLEYAGWANGADF